MNTVVTDLVLGKLTLDAGLNWYEGEFLSKEGGAVRITVSLDALPSADIAIQEARVLIPLVVQSLQAAKEFACDKLLSLKNESWLEEGEPAVSRSAFIARLSVESVGVYADRECEVFFKDGDLFWGHTVLLSWNQADGYYGADIAG